MPTVKQKKAIEKTVINGGNISKGMVEAGYSPATANNPKNLTESKGFMELCEKVGLTNEMIAQALADDIKAKPKNRVPELSLAAKLKGLERSPIIPGMSTVNIILQSYGITNERGDAREADQAIPSPHQSETQS